MQPDAMQKERPRRRLLRPLCRVLAKSVHRFPHCERTPVQDYDDPNFSYPGFWQGRKYEHEAELTALRALLGGKRFRLAADIGGGFGRLSSFLSQRSDAVVLVEPSVVQRRLAERQVPENVRVCAGSASQTGLPDGCCDLVAMVRVMHHLPDPKASIAEIRRILKPGGFLVLEFANSLHAKSRLKRVVRFGRTPLGPVRVGGSRKTNVPFVNHHPKTVRSALVREGFIIEAVLSVSNLRSATLKKVLPVAVMLWIESATQHILGPLHFGPSVFVLARRA